MTYHACPRCKTLIPVGVSYCPKCAPIVEAQRAAATEQNRKRKTKAYNQRRDPKYSKFYHSPDWRRTSRAYLDSIGYQCEAHLSPDCTGLAVEVHHRIPIQTSEGWAHRLDWDNLEAVCIQCHNARHNRFGKKCEKGVIDLKKVENDLKSREF